LIVDDEKTNVAVLSRFLSQRGYATDSAFNGAQALEKITKSQPDVLLLDVLMPVMDGLTVCRTLRADVATQSLPIILVTARTAIDDRITGLKAGVDDYIAKPFDLDEVEARLEGALKRRRLDLSSNPLTHLPGSPTIEEEVWKRLRMGFPFAFAYLDIDQFKAYNDVYGYEAGDKVIKRLGTIMSQAVKRSPTDATVAGHIGGDDFVLIADVNYMKSIIPRIAVAFDV
jgi:PleD family two-component response regulator